MLFHTNFENPMISYHQKKTIEKEKETEETPPVQRKYKYTVRKIIPKKTKPPNPPSPPQENEVRLSKVISEEEKIKDLIQERKRIKRKKYKMNRKKKMKEIKAKPISEGERQMNEIIRHVENNHNLEFGISVYDHSQNLNNMTYLYNQFMEEGDVLEL
jgi:hypothetical protein